MSRFYLISYVAGQKNSLSFGDELCWFDDELMYEDIEEARMFIAQKKKYDRVTILNVIPVKKEGSYNGKN